MQEENEVVDAPVEPVAEEPQPEEQPAEEQPPEDEPPVEPNNEVAEEPNEDPEE
jgi:hypothetical protein